MDFVKIAVALCLYAAFAPLLGMWLARARVRQRATFAAMLAMTALRPGNFTFMIGSIETYRGHAKGFEVSLLEVLSLALIVAVILEARRRGIEVLSEIELAYRWEQSRPNGPRPMVGITGTDGKTTTTLMASAILDHAGRRCGAVGNTETPLISVGRDL